MRVRAMVAVLALTVAVWTCRPGQAGPPPVPPQTYVAVGDSVAFGYETSANQHVSNGDQGYVQPFADYLTARTPGVRPHVVNLAIPGETSASFFSGGKIGRLLNSNYASTTARSQAALLKQTLSAQRKSGATVRWVTVQLGANDLNALITPQFLRLSPAKQTRAVEKALAHARANVKRVLARIHAEASEATVYVLDYYNPISDSPDDPRYPLFSTAIPALNGVLQTDAAAAGARFVDLYAPFQGHEAEWTFFTQLGYPEGIHPTDAGYAEIAMLLEAVEAGNAAGAAPARKKVSTESQR